MGKRVLSLCLAAAPISDPLPGNKLETSVNCITL